MDNHDGIMTLLRQPDPIEKGIALKSKHVEPYHLRHALQDSDFYIRSVAAKHPKLTRELMREVLSGEEKDLKHLVLARPDVDESELSLLVHDPDHALEVARHPKCTDALRQKALDFAPLPDGVKAEHVQRLSKNIGHITYPLLGEGKVYTRPMGVSNAEKAAKRQAYVFEDKNTKLKDSAHGAMNNSAAPKASEPLPPQHRQMSGWMRPNPKLDEPARSKNLNATEGHESQHAVYARLGQRFGEDAQRRIVATTLSKLPDREREHIKNLFNATRGVTGDPTVDPEETIAYLHHYLQDPHHRTTVHSRLGFHLPEEQAESFKVAREAWKKLRRTGMALRPEDVGVDVNKERSQVKSWVKNLRKRESIPSDQLGFSVSFHELIAIAQFLTGEQVDLSVVRQCLMTNGGDPADAVQTAYGLNTPEGRKAFDNVKTLKLHKTEDVLKAPKSIVGLDDPEIANVLKQAYESGHIESIALGGKHSSGSYILKDETGHNWLLKPGSGKKSPAAGVDETKGSQSRREACFSGIAQWLGIEEVQPAHLVQVDGKEVAAIRMWPMDWTNLQRSMYEDPNIPQRALTPYLRDGRLFRWSVLDFITGNPDRHGNNLMVSAEEDGNKIGLIDHGSAFAGHSFDPGNDKNSFVPYYLRAWAPASFHGMGHEDQIKVMPKLSGEADVSFAQWVETLDPAELAKVCHKYGIDPEPVIARLAEIQSNPMAESTSEHVNRCWLESPTA
jgi:hypothetical protein